MHESVFQFVQELLDRKGPDGQPVIEIAGKVVIEVGSQDVNGSIRPLFEARGPAAYTGTDFADGPGVDLVLPANMLDIHFGQQSADVLVSCEMLEHAEHWQHDIEAMKRVLKIGGVAIITCRGPGFPYHGYPHDYWRFTPEHFGDIFVDFETIELRGDHPFPGVLYAGRRTIRGVIGANELWTCAVNKAPARLASRFER